MRLNGVGRGGVGNFPYPPRLAPFNFLNGTGMGIIFNKWGGVGMGATRPVAIPMWATSGDCGLHVVAVVAMGCMWWLWWL